MKAEELRIGNLVWRPCCNDEVVEIRENCIIGSDRLRGDYFKKPTAYWFFNCVPTYGYSFQKDKKQKKVWECKSAGKAGLCSEERSLISPDYARNFILGKEQNNSIPTLF